MAEKHQEQILESVLAELIGGQGPPDLSARVSQAFEARKSSNNGVGSRAPAEITPPPAGTGQAAGGGISHTAPGVAAPTTPERPLFPVADVTLADVSVAARRGWRRRRPWPLLATAVVAASVVLAVGIAIVQYAGGQKEVADDPHDPPIRSGNGGLAANSSTQGVNPEKGASRSAIDDGPQEVETVHIRPRVANTGEANSSSGGRKPSAPPTLATADPDIIKFVNNEVRSVWKEAGVGPSPAATDAEWCRRVYLDVLGRIPRLDELQSYVASRAKDKKEKLVDALLESDAYAEEYARNWTTIFTNLLIGRTGGMRNNSLANRAGLQQYLRRSLQTNKPYDQMVVELVSAEGAGRPGAEDYNGAVNFIADNLQENATTATAKTARYFLGMQVQCTQCHNHPFNEWKQNQFWELNAFFRQARVARTGDGDNATVRLVDEDFAGENRDIKNAAVFYELRNNISASAYPVFVDGASKPASTSGRVADVRRRQELARFIVASPNFGQAIVNRVWAHFLGYGFTKPVDDMGPHNPPTHPDLLARLGTEFAGGGHDLKRLARWIVLSEPYALSSVYGQRYKNAIDDPATGEKPLFSHFYLRQMEAEQLYQSLLVATTADKTQGSYEEQEVAKAEWLGQFSIAFGTDEGDETTTFNGTIPQVLMLMNGPLTDHAIKCEPGSFLHSVVYGNQNRRENLEYLYKAALGRPPTRQEIQAANELLSLRGGDAGAAMQDVWWALLNSGEFIFNR